MKTESGHTITPLITIVTVCYNAENDIGYTLQSVKDQHFTDYEHLLIDGQSSDATVELIQSNSNPKIRLISEPDTGIYDAMNKGIRLAKGRFITFLNAGDFYFNSDTLGHVAKEINNGYELISGNFLLASPTRNKLITSDIIDLRRLKKRFEVCHQTVFVKNFHLPFYSLDYKIKADYKWVLDIAKDIDQSKIKKIDLPLVCYKGDGFSTESFYRNQAELMKLHYKEFGLGRVILNIDDYSKRAARSLKKLILNQNIS